MTSRPLTPAEYAWATAVFGPTLPPRARIRISRGVGLGRRPFTVPGPRGTTVFLGRDHADPVRSNPVLFAHELTHVWQLTHARHRLWWLAGAAVVQVRYLLGRDVYDPGEREWSACNVEQQATLVGRWVGTHPPGERPARSDPPWSGPIAHPAVRRRLRRRRRPWP